jgi:hypothetical protein
MIIADKIPPRVKFLENQICLPLFTYKLSVSQADDRFIIVPHGQLRKEVREIRENTAT